MVYDQTWLGEMTKGLIRRRIYHLSLLVYFRKTFSFDLMFEFDTMHVKTKESS